MTRHHVKAFTLGLVLVLTCPIWLPTTLCAKQDTATAHAQGTAGSNASTVDFEVKNGPDGFLVRRKGTQEWIRPSALNEPIVVGVLESGHKIYLPTKAFMPPKAKQTEDPEFPEAERRFRNHGWARLHLVVDDKGIVRQPTADDALSPAFAEAAVNAVSRWKFQPATLDSQPVAVLIRVEIQFRLD